MLDRMPTSQYKNGVSYVLKHNRLVVSPILNRQLHLLPPLVLVFEKEDHHEVAQTMAEWCYDLFDSVSKRDFPRTLIC